MSRHTLIAHADHPPPARVTLSAEWTMQKLGSLMLQYRVVDPERRILWPPAASGRADNLWQHSCFEAFIGSSASAAYAEFNLSPSGAWAAYAFDDYRAGMRDLTLVAAPVIAGPQADQWTASLDLAGLDDLIGPAPWRLALTAVIEAKDGSKSFWSLAHPPGKPDFHHPDCFAARLG